MNSLSWMIYFADRASTVQAAGGFFGGALLLLALFTLIGSFIGIIDTKDEVTVAVAKMANTYRRWFLGFGVACIAAATIMPSRDAILLIAASEIGERAITQPATAELLSDVGEIIRSEVKKLKEKAK